MRYYIVVRGFMLLVVGVCVYIALPGKGQRYQSTNQWQPSVATTTPRMDRKVTAVIESFGARQEWSRILRPDQNAKGVIMIPEMRMCVVTQSEKVTAFVTVNFRLKSGSVKFTDIVVQKKSLYGEANNRLTLQKCVKYFENLGKTVFEWEYDRNSGLKRMFPGSRNPVYKIIEPTGDFPEFGLNISAFRPRKPGGHLGYSSNYC